jgi:hypothetical protein
MDKVTKEYIELHAPDSSTTSNATKLSSKGSFLKHSKIADDSLYFAECSGSGKNNYKVSVDFMTENQPVFRCNCPSRKLPCKHSIGLLFDILGNKTFKIEDIPEDILEKRTKAVVREEKAKIKKENPTTDAPKKVNKNARLKKIKQQLEGLEMAEKIVVQILSKGLGTVEGDSISTYQNLAKELGNYYLPGPQNYIYELIDEIEDIKIIIQDGGTVNYSNAVKVLVKLNSIIKKSKQYLTSRLEEENVEDDDNELFEQLGGVWRLDELKEIGLYKENPNIAQLAFTIVTSEASKQYIDIGFWIDIETGVISSTYNYRPFKALKYINQDDSLFDVIIPETMVYYPGKVNQRIRWDKFQTRDITQQDFTKIFSFGQDIATTIKSSKDYLKNTLSQNYLPVLIAYTKIGESSDGSILLEDASDSSLKLSTMKGFDTAMDSILLLPDKNMYKDQTIFGCIFYDEIEKSFKLHPFSIVSENNIIRLLY